MSDRINSINKSAYSGNAKLNEQSDEKLQEERVMNGGANIQNSTDVNGENSFCVFSAVDGDNDASISFAEAQSEFGSIFNDADTKLNQNALIDNAIKSSKRLTQENQNGAEEIVQKYLGNSSVDDLKNDWSGFANIEYDSVGVQNKYEATGTAKDTGVQAKINAAIEQDVKAQVNDLSEQMQSQFETVLDKALVKAENQLVGDADIFDDNGNVKSDINIDDLKYTRETGADAHNISTYNSVKSGNPQTQGYINTVNVLKGKGAKLEQKLVNGVKQEIYKLDGQFYIVDDAGQMHELVKDDGFLRSSKFTTKDSIEDAKYQSKNDGIEGNDFNEKTAKKVKVKVRNVDGRNQSVLTWKDEKGNKHARVIDYNEETGMTSSVDVHQTNQAGTRAKYTSESSGLGAWVAADDDDGRNVRQFKDKSHMVQDAVHSYGETGFVRTRRGMMKIDSKNIDVAIDNMVKNAETLLGKDAIQDFGDEKVITVNGHEYRLDLKKDHKDNDRTMRLIQSELNQINGQKQTQEPVAEPQKRTLKVSDITFEDSRASAGDWGVNSDTLEAKSTEINTIKYDEDFSRTHFVNQVWGASQDRVEEKAVIELMNNYMKPADKEGDNPTVTTDVTGMSTATEFAERFLEVALGENNFITSGVEGKSFKDFDVDKLASAIKTANPSFFDADGNMFKDCDFNRINLPRKLDEYLE